MEKHLFKDITPVARSRDLPYNIEVKTRSRYNYDLLIQLDDDPSKLFVLVTYEKAINAKKVFISGWAYGSIFVSSFVVGHAMLFRSQS